MTDRQHAIAALNDQLCSALPTGSVMLTPGIRALPVQTQLQVLARVRAFNDFSADNDPYGEHDFGSIDHADAGRIFWKIDYYDATLTAGSPDSADPIVTRRLLTVMLAEEY
ncbi:DUF3768 domain-containing protein [Ancylobacter defluvii]|uniref:DUF3768 domain-containing protein n=1 Tax=Ancylobacter defluvii TaxID=1282440 RepID=A0A9W6JV34_9HYPH|nr:DUF3768 domain-containing protein [Ancylobacter defluvii]MBS7587872.1 DUF3768 domain-containing protein [Ancylobacter defluvii]GLK83702.1 hypothetical protein GCM10017653_17710 [Ancylobacter defluvii]